MRVGSGPYLPSAAALLLSVGYWAAGYNDSKQASLSLLKPSHLVKRGLLTGSPAGWATQGFC